MAAHGHKYSASLTTNQKAQLANAYNELGKELSSQRIKVVGNYTLGKLIGEGTPTTSAFCSSGLDLLSPQVPLAPFGWERTASREHESPSNRFPKPCQPS